MHQILLLHLLWTFHFQCWRPRLISTCFHSNDPIWLYIVVVIYLASVCGNRWSLGRIPDYSVWRRVKPRRRTWHNRKALMGSYVNRHSCLKCLNKRLYLFGNFNTNSHRHQENIKTGLSSDRLVYIVAGCLFHSFVLYFFHSWIHFFPCSDEILS